MSTSLENSFLTSLLIILGLSVSSGCAFGTRHAELTYPPVDREPGALVAAARAGEAGAACCDVVLNVSDMRAETRRIGNVRNTFGMDTADVVTSDDVRTWVEDAFKHELTSAGYAVVPAGSDHAIMLDADITKVHCDVYLTYDGEVSMTVSLSREGMPALEKHYEGSGSVGLSWAATAQSYAGSLALALQDAVSHVMQDLAKFRNP